MTIIKLLVVDDAIYVLKALRDLLEAHCYEVHEAVNGEEALAKYGEVNPDMVLMDILMPKVDGLTTTRKILEYDPNAKIIVVTAVGKPGLEEECIKAGASGFIRKPYRIKDLLNIVNSLGKNERN